MDTTNEMLIPSIVLISLLALITVTLIALLVVLIRNKSKPAVITVDTTQFDAELERIMSATAHAADVSAVLKLMEQLDDNEDALELIKSYPETVRAAAWLHYINTLGADLQAAQKDLSDAHQGKGRFQYHHGYMLADLRKGTQEHVDMIRAKLDKAVAASGQSGLRLVN